MDSYIESSIQQILGAHAEGVIAGMDHIEKRLNPALRTLAAAYAKADADPKACLPTELALAILNVLQLLAKE